MNEGVAAKVRVLVVDDSSFMRSILAKMLARDKRFEVIGSAENGAEGVEQVRLLSPDVVTMDIEMPVMDGLSALKKIMQDQPTPVVMLSSLTEEGAAATLEALESGAVDFIPKALQDGGRSVFNNFHILTDKIYAAAQAKLANAASVAVATPAETVSAAPMLTAVPSQGQYSVVVVGTSTGGPRALNQFIAGLPRLGVPMLIAQHMPEGFTATMARRLNELGVNDVVELVDAQPIEAGKIYVCPGGAHTRLEEQNGQVVGRVVQDEGDSLFKPSAEVLAASAQVVFGNKVCAVMLTGMGNDGAAAYASIKAAGGRVIVQDEATCVVYGMPKAVVDMDGANEILPLDKIAVRVGQLVS